MDQDQGSKLMNIKYLQMSMVIFCSVFSLVSCSESDEKGDSDSMSETSEMSKVVEEKISESIDIDELVKQTEQTREQADKLGFEWSTTKSLIDKAHAAMKESNSELAVSLLQEAKVQSELAIKQAHYANEHWQSYVPKN